MPDSPENGQGGEIVEATPRTVCWARGEDWNDGSTSLVFQIVKNLPTMLETWVWSLGQEDPLEKGMTTHFSILAWRIPWTEEPGVLQAMGSWRVRHNGVTNEHTSWRCSAMRGGGDGGGGGILCFLKDGRQTIQYHSNPSLCPNQ